MAASDLCDKHAIKMVLESTQMLSTVAIEKGFSAPYKQTHKNHPCTKWVGKDPSNWDWLVTHAKAMCKEYSKRYYKIHKCEALIYELSNRIWKNEGNYLNHTEFVQCMPDEYKRPNAVYAYRAYYIGAKKDFAKWKLPETKPSWFN